MAVPDVDRSGGGAHEETPDAPTPETPHPPAVYTTPDLDDRPVAPRSVACTVVLQFPSNWCRPDLELRPLGRWTVRGKDDDDSDPEHPVPHDGRIELDAATIEEWGSGRLEVEVPGFRPRHMTRPEPPPATGATIALGLEPEDSIRTWTGRVVDERGRGVPDAGVGRFDEGDSLVPSAVVRTDAVGEFRIAVPRDTPERPDGASPTVWLVAATLGQLPAETPAPSGGAEGLELRMGGRRPDPTLRLVLETPAGGPAVGARLLLHAADEAGFDDSGLPRWTNAGSGDALVARARAVVERVRGRRTVRSQGWYPVQGGACLQDHVADDDGIVEVLGVSPGRYVVEAVLLPPTEADRGSQFGAHRASSTLRADVTVAAGSDVTEVGLRFPAARAVEGRIRVETDPTWNDGKVRHTHWLSTIGIPWSGVTVETGVRGDGAPYTGRFRWEGLGPEARTLRIWTSPLGVQEVELPAGPAGGVVDVGEIIVGNASALLRVLIIAPVHADGSDPAVPRFTLESSTAGDSGLTPPVVSVLAFNEPGFANLLVRRRLTADDRLRVTWRGHTGVLDGPFVFGENADPMRVSLAPIPETSGR